MLVPFLLLAAVQTMPVPAEATEQVVEQDKASAIAALYLPAEPIKAAARRQVGAMLARNFDADPAGVAMERRYPGARAAWIGGGLTELDAIYARELPSLRARIAEEIRRALSPAEQSEVAGFLSSPTGQALTAGLFAAFDPAQASADGLATLASVRAATDMAAVDARLTPEQRDHLGAFYTSPTGRKYKRLSARLQTIGAENANSSSARRIALVEAAANAAVERHLRQRRGL